MENKGYEDKKEFICTHCEDIVMATKFASQKTILCEKCKTAGLKPIPEVVAKLLASTKKISIKPKTEISGDTKSVTCINCGKPTIIGKFASAKTALCNDCKEHGVDISSVDVQVQQEQRPDFKVNPDKIDWTKIKPIEEYKINEIVIANKKLQKVVCPACGHEHMKILSVMDSTQFGIIAKYQCEMCLLAMTLSEQTRTMQKVQKPGHRYNYNGEEIEKLALGTMEDTRLSNAVQILLQKCRDNNIDLSGYDLPPYFYRDDKPVPVGLVIPKNDKLIQILSELTRVFNTSQRIGNIEDEPEGTRNILISDTLAKQLAHDISNYLKEEE